MTETRSPTSPDPLRQDPRTHGHVPRGKSARRRFAQKLARKLAERLDPHCPTTIAPHGMSSGLNLEPGSNDDGWIVPPPVRLSDGTQLQLYKDGEALHAAYQAIRGAQSRVFLEVYIFANDETGRAFDELLCEKAGQGVQVYLMYDALGSLGGGGDVFKQLRTCGGRVEPFHPIFPWDLKVSGRPWNRDHR